MKKLILCVLFVITSNAIAAKGSVILAVSVKNSTSSNCYLISKNLELGVFLPGAELAVKLVPGEESQTVQILPKGVRAQQALTLTYDCGTGQSITIKSSRGTGIGARGRATGEIVAFQNMYAGTDIGSFSILRPATIHWNLT
ncbi:MAG: hypothetical protein NXI01_07745 [Gammaproteobacteria bacterium]|nr:hypothetical protein [Gammaproteobacteria bacterium]